MRLTHCVLLMFLSVIRAQDSGTCRPGWHYFEGSCYDVGASAVTWADGEEFCRIASARLAEIDSEEENNFVKNLVKSRSDVAEAWLGGTDIYEEGFWVWVSSGQNIYPFTDWADGQPNDGGAGEDCLAYKKVVNYQWADGGCNELRYFICEAEAEVVVG